MCYTCGQKGYFMRDYPTLRGNIGGAKSQDNSSVPPQPPKGTISASGDSYNRLYAFFNFWDLEASLDVVTGTL